MEKPREKTLSRNEEKEEGRDSIWADRRK